jgi:hypothetical protein
MNRGLSRRACPYGGVLDDRFDHAERMLAAVTADADGNRQREVFFNVNAARASSCASQNCVSQTAFHKAWVVPSFATAAPSPCPTSLTYGRLDIAFRPLRCPVLIRNAPISRVNIFRYFLPRLSLA